MIALQIGEQDRRNHWARVVIASSPATVLSTASKELVIPVGCVLRFGAGREHAMPLPAEAPFALRLFVLGSRLVRYGMAILGAGTGRAGWLDAAAGARLG